MPKKPHPKPRPVHCRCGRICALLKWIVRHLCEDENENITVNVTFNEPEPK